MSEDYEALDRMLVIINEARAKKMRRDQDVSRWNNILAQDWQREVHKMLTRAQQLFTPLNIAIHGTDLGQPNAIPGKLFVRMSYNRHFNNPRFAAEIEPLEFSLEDSGIVRVTSANEGARLDFLSIEGAFPHKEVCQILADHIGAALRRRDGL